ncbi:MAG: Rieske 2Fe-2S domain-containing protein [Alphaproteobacteria bacterium]|nr:Rieske 2Fe-2S domain-containing protein [Alphaproteobacteria bacterium]
MAHEYKAVQWNRFKRRYDAVLSVGIAGYLSAFVVATNFAFAPGQSMTMIQVLMRAFGSCAFGLLTLILLIGPLARLSPRFLPLLYNRRHLGVACFFLALVHAVLALIWYQGFSDVNPFVALLTSNPRYTSIDGFPFEILGAVALAILFVMAATSHDFWNTNLGPRFWKTLHMGVYFAYALLVAHLALGVIQYEKSLLYVVIIGAAAVLVPALHVVTGGRERKRDLSPDARSNDGWITVGPARDIPDCRARIVVPPRGERIAVFRDGSKIFAVSNVCRHQGGPLGEGRIVDGCITCPWHGFQYRPESGTSPPPFTDKIATYRTRIVDGAVHVYEKAMPPGTTVAPSIIAP